MSEDLSLKHSPNIADIVNAVDAVRTVELDYTDLCGMDTLIIINDDVICPLKIIGGTSSFKMIRKGII